jgi:manganese/iron transport system ATP-binding protein
MSVLNFVKKQSSFQDLDSVHLPGKPLLELEQVSVTYDSGVALEDVTCVIHRGERIAVVGPNGAGKSTLFKVIAGIIQPTFGSVKVSGSDPHGHICISYVPQKNQVDWNFPATVEDAVMMGRAGKIGLGRRPRSTDWQVVHEALETVGMMDMSNRQINQLSGGQQQRVFIARALAQEAGIMLMDEPITGLDQTSQEGVMNILDRLKSHQVTVLVALHDLNLAAQRFDRLMLLNHTLIACGPPDTVLTSDHLITAYGNHIHMIPSKDGVLMVGDSCCQRGASNDD